MVLLWACGYLWLTLKHKWFVLLAGLRTGTPVPLLILHDCSKLTPVGLLVYGRQFFGDRGDPPGFARARLHHRNKNPHHWEYWTPTPGGEPLPMPMRYVREMVADWMAAARAYEGRWPDPNNWPWLDQYHQRMLLHPVTRERINLVLCQLRGSAPRLLTFGAPGDTLCGSKRVAGRR